MKNLIIASILIAMSSCTSQNNKTEGSSDRTVSSANSLNMTNAQAKYFESSYVQLFENSDKNINISTTRKYKEKMENFKRILEDSKLSPAAKKQQLASYIDYAKMNVIHQTTNLAYVPDFVAGTVQSQLLSQLSNVQLQIDNGNFEAAKTTALSAADWLLSISNLN